MGNLGYFGLLVLSLGAFGGTGTQPLTAAPVEINLKAYTTRNASTYLVPNFPTGQVIPPLNNFGVPFSIPAEGRNFFTIEDKDRPLPIHVGVVGVKKVYTLIQAYGPHAGDEILTVEFSGDQGAYQRFLLIVGKDVRDFFESGFSRTINNTTTRPAFEFIGHGGAYTDDVKTGPRGFYDFDEQEFVLDPSFLSQTLESITFTRHTDYGTPMILGITAVNSQPEATFEESLRFWLMVSAGLMVFGAIGLIIWVRRWLKDDNSP
jgi:hypothetical protein